MCWREFLDVCPISELFFSLFLKGQKILFSSSGNRHQMWEKENFFSEESPSSRLLLFLPHGFCFPTGKTICFLYEFLFFPLAMRNAGETVKIFFRCLQSRSRSKCFCGKKRRNHQRGNETVARVTISQDKPRALQCSDLTNCRAPFSFTWKCTDRRRDCIENKQTTFFPRASITRLWRWSNRPS